MIQKFFDRLVVLLFGLLSIMGPVMLIAIVAYALLGGGR